ncbi:MAG: lipopolysaccharide biosynthesis protein RfbH [Candidatus Falkowbacteria bacterium]
MNEGLKTEVIKEYNERFPQKQFVAGTSPIPVSGKVFDEQEMLNMVEAVMEGWWTEGKYAKEFEEKIAEYVGVKFGSAVNSGSSANLLAVTALTSFRLPEERRLKPGDEVITVAAGFPTTINPIIQNGLVPVFIDVELGTYNPNFEQIKAAVTSKTKAVIIAHTLGNPYDVEQIAEFCKENNLWLIEDNCDALGSKFNQRHTGTFGDIATLSFYPAHHITMAEGGAVLTSNSLLHKIVRSLRDWGRDCSCPTGVDNFCGNRFNKQLGNLPQGYDHKYTYSEIGYNLKITDIQAALGLAQLDKVEKFIEKRRNNFSYLLKAFGNFEQYFILPKAMDTAEPSWFGFLLTVKDDADFKRDDLIKFLNQKRIGTRLLFGGNITKQPYFINYNIEHRVVGELKNTDKIMNDTFWIGVYPGITTEMLDFVIESFKEFLSGQNSLIDKL